METIFDGKQFVIPMFEVSHIEKYSDDEYQKSRILVVMKHSKYNSETQQFEPSIHLNGKQSLEFMKCWCQYRYEFEKLTQ